MSATPTLASYLEDLRREIDDALDRALASLSAPALLSDAMRYSLMAGGKRLRPCLTLATAEAAGSARGLDVETAKALALPAAVAVEMIHSYSLVHDDLPAMDDDALRRGRPTSHVVYGDGLAILAGDGLLTDAFGMIARSPSPASAPDAPTMPPERRLAIIEIVAGAAGAAGMVGGQALDLAAVGRVAGRSVPIADTAALEDMHRRKTGALIRAAVVSGAVSVGAGDPVVVAADDYARELGLAFQIIDDVLDVEGSAEALGKTAGKDAAAGKPTYVSMYGLTASRALAAACVERAAAALSRVGLEGRLAEIAAWSLTRRA